MRLEDWIRRLPWRVHSQRVVLVLLWVGWGACYLFGYRAQVSQFSQVRTALIPLHEKMEQYSALIRQRPNPDEGLEDLHRRFQLLKEQGIGKEAVPRAIQQLARLAAETRVTLETIGPRDDIPLRKGQLPEGVGKRVIELKVRCDYQALGEFLYKLDELSSRFTVDALSIRSDLKSVSGEIQAVLLLGTYGLL